MSVVLGNINLFVNDIDRTKQFYIQVLGLDEDEERSAPPSFVLLNAGGCDLTLQDRSASGAAFGKVDSIKLGSTECATNT